MAGRNITYTMSFIFQGKNFVAGPAGAAAQSAVTAQNAIQNSVQGTKKAVNELAGAYNALVVAQHLGGYLKAAVTPALELADATNRLRVTTRLGAENMEKMQAAAMKAAEKTPYGPAEMMDMAQRLLLAVRDVDVAAKMLPSVAMFAKVAFEGDLTKAVNVARFAILGFGLDADGAIQALNKILAVSHTVGVPMDDFYQGLKKLSIAAKVSGSSFEETLATYGLILRVMPTAASAATLTKSAMLAVSNTAKRSALEQALSINLLDQSTGKLLSMDKIMLILSQKATEYSNNSTEFMDILTQAFGRQAIAAEVAGMTALTAGLNTVEDGTLRGSAALAQIHADMDASDNLLEKLGKAWMTAPSEIFGTMFESVRNLLAVAFQPLAAGIVIIADALTVFVQLIRMAMTELGPFSLIIRGVVWALGLLALMWSVLFIKQVVVAAYSRIVALSLKFIQEAASGVTVELTSASGAIGYFMAMSNKMVKTAPTVAYAIRGLALAFKALRSVLLPAGIMLAIEALGFVAKKFGFLGGEVEDLAKREQNGLMSTRAAHKAALDATIQVQNKIRDSIAALDEALTKVVDKLLDKPPEFSASSFNKLEALIKGSIQDKRLINVGRAQEKLDILREIITQGGVRSDNELIAARRALQEIGPLATRQQYNVNAKGVPDLTKVLKDMATALENFMHPKVSIGTISRIYGVDQEEFIKNTNAARAKLSQEVITSTTVMEQKIKALKALEDAKYGPTQAGSGGRRSLLSLPALLESEKAWKNLDPTKWKAEHDLLRQNVADFDIARHNALEMPKNPDAAAYAMLQALSNEGAIVGKGKVSPIPLSERVNKSNQFLEQVSYNTKDQVKLLEKIATNTAPGNKSGGAAPEAPKPSAPASSVSAGDTPSGTPINLGVSLSARKWLNQHR